MMMRIMSNKWVIKFLSIPIVMKILTAQMKAMMWLQSKFSRKKNEQAQSSESGNQPPAK